MMWPYYYSPASWMMLVGGALTWALFIALAVFLARAAWGGRRIDSALDVLRRRLAAGEISPEEYERTRRILEG